MHASASSLAVVSLLLFGGGTAFAQAGQDEASLPGYTMKVAVDEVEVTFHATDKHGLSVNDLKADEIRVLDNWKPPRRIVSFQSLLDRPIRAALLVDASLSMEQALATSKEVVQHFAQNILRQSSDQAMIMDFGYSSEFLQRWTIQPTALTQSLQGISVGHLNPVPGTAILDTVFRACFYGFEKTDPDATANFILLFTDGENNAGQVTLDQALRACQRSNTIIYSFRFPSTTGTGSTGPKLLQDLANGTGGRVFAADDTMEALWSDLKIIESDARNRYRLVYSPAQLAHDGAFHSIGLELPDRVDRIEVRSGYFAPSH